jgi:nucleoside-diphosphate-sugar epimerase
MKILVIGGTLFIGRRLVQSLVKLGHEVAVLHRRPEHDLGRKVENLQADRNDPRQVYAAVKGRSFDGVFDLAYDWERGTPGRVIHETASMLNGNVGRYVFMSSCAAYGDGLNHHEGDALAPEEHPNLYMRNKACSERALFRLHQRYGTPVVTLRPPFVYGPGNPMYREQFFWDRLRDKRPLILPGDGRRLMQFVYVKDLVEACLKVLEAPNVTGHAFNIANARPLTQCEVLEALAKAAGKPGEIVRVPRERIMRAGGHPMGPLLYFGTYFDVPPITTIISKAQRVLGFKPTSFEAGLQETYRWYVRHYKRVPQDYSFEDSLLERARLAS